MMTRYRIAIQPEVFDGFIDLQDVEEAARDLSYGYCNQTSFCEGEEGWAMYAGADSGPYLCEVLGTHVYVDRSHAGPESGDMDYACIRCGRYWRVPLY